MKSVFVGLRVNEKCVCGVTGEGRVCLWVYG